MVEAIFLKNVSAVIPPKIISKSRRLYSCYNTNCFTFPLIENNQPIFASKTLVYPHPPPPTLGTLLVIKINFDFDLKKHTCLLIQRLCVKAVPSGNNSRFLMPFTQIYQILVAPKIPSQSPL